MNQITAAAPSFTTEEGLSVAPLAERLMLEQPRPWRRAGDWSVSQRMDHPEPEGANALALLDLEGGADALVLVGQDSPFSRGFGLALDRDTIRSALRGIEIDLIAMRLDAGSGTPAAARALAGLLSDRRLKDAGIVLDFCFDPIGIFARSGQAWDIADLVSVVTTSRDCALRGTPLLADGRPYHEAGAGDAQELAAVLATVVGYLRHLDGKCGTREEALAAIGVLISAEPDVLFETAKVRAMRRLFARIGALCGLDPSPMRLHVETSWRMMTRHDPWSNSMRTTAAAAAAGLGGADTVVVLPMSLASGLPNADARRLARNTSRVLIDEAAFGRVDDPAAGAGTLEALTTDLCERSWKLFQDIERAGGIEASLRKGDLQTAIAQTAAARATNVATLARKIVGTSRFPRLDAPAVTVLEVAPRPALLAVDNMTPCRDSEPFETLRAGAEALAKDGQRPKVFLVPLGEPASSAPRMAEAANVFAVAGIEALAPQPGIAPAEIGQRFLDSGAVIACLCGSEASYAASSAHFITALRTAKVRRLLILSKDANWSAKGVDATIGDGCNLLHVLGDALEAAC